MIKITRQGPLKDLIISVTKFMVKKLLRISKKSLYIPNILQMVSDKKNNNALKFSYSLKAINIEKGCDDRW